MGMRYMRNNNLVVREIADEYFLIPITNHGADLQKIYHLNHTAAAVWHCLEESVDIDSILKELAAEYHESMDVIRPDVEEIVQDLLQRGFCRNS